ncbi:MAG: creatininase family protein [Gammaproteobacteria bacterium]
MRSSGLLVADVSWPKVECALADGCIAALPIGAAAKEHGFHLPLNTDYLQAEWLARQLVEAVPVVVWPTLSYGYYPVFVDYPGSISLQRETFCSVVQDVLAGIARAGARSCAVLNTGISTIAPLEGAIRRDYGRMAVALINVYAGPRFTRVSEEIEEQPFGGHADEIETSLMLTMHPERVDMARATPAPAQIRRGLFNRRDPQGPNFSPSGVNGDPTRATAEKGRRLAAAMREDVLEAIAALRGAC